MYEKFRTFCTNICIKKKIFKTMNNALGLKHLQNTFLVTFFNVVFRIDKHLISRL